MFQGKNFRIEHVGKNRYKLCSPYMLVEKTAQEIDTLLSEQMNDARRSALELAICKQRLRESAEAENQPIATHVVSAATAAPSPTPAPLPVPERPAPSIKPAGRRASVEVASRRKRSPGGLQYAMQLAARAR